MFQNSQQNRRMTKNFSSCCQDRIPPTNLDTLQSSTKPHQGAQRRLWGRVCRQEGRKMQVFLETLFDTKQKFEAKRQCILSRLSKNLTINAPQWLGTSFVVSLAFYLNNLEDLMRVHFCPLLGQPYHEHPCYCVCTVVGHMLEWGWSLVYEDSQKIHANLGGFSGGTPPPMGDTMVSSFGLVPKTKGPHQGPTPCPMRTAVLVKHGPQSSLPNYRSCPMMECEDETRTEPGFLVALPGTVPILAAHLAGNDRKEQRVPRQPQIDKYVTNIHLFQDPGLLGLGKETGVAG